MVWYFQVDIQALAHAVELTRQGSVDSLKFAKGDLLLAFQVSLCTYYNLLVIVRLFIYQKCIMQTVNCVCRMSCAG